MYSRVNGKPCQIVWFMMVWELDKETGDYDLKQLPGIYLTREAAEADMRRKHITARKPQYNLYEGTYYKGEILSYRKVMAKDESGMFEDEDFDVDYYDMDYEE